MTAGEQAVLAGVVASRLVVPLFIPRFPLPAILIALVVDGLDQTIFQWAGMASLLANYQSYDKALDVYYLVIAYTATLRNWDDPTAFRVGRFLWYWRLIGVVAFETSGWRPLLLIFPNTFEYFFIAYEAVRCLWRPTRVRGRNLILLAGIIWVVVKLPQEWWIHVAQLDATDEIRRHSALAITLGAIALAVLVATAVTVAPRLPRPDWRFTVDVDAHQPEREPNLEPEELRHWLAATAEKAALTAAVLAIFSHILPTSASTPVIVAVVAVVAVLNAAASEVIEWLRRMPSRIAWRFVLMVLLNAVLFEIIQLVGGRISYNRVTAATFLLLLSLVITFYDQFRGIRHGVTISWPGRSRAAAVQRPA